jgi:hypothetical protein
LYLTKFRI